MSDSIGNGPSLILNDRMVMKLEVLFLFLKEKTGVYVDPYGKTRIYPEHQKILIKYLESKSKDGDIAAFVEFLVDCIYQDGVIIAYGD
ncbi:hypothetical protein DOX44_003785 [Cronobacter turicensis]|nr:hypothetical protein [Cronobacter turicensis]ELY4324005.1 hypothetical protein [Cronobacter turicensis]ELY5944009.1 hypothetical protein [Cronobacter turicensis]ELY5965374.1 hypothetical protein [Cronobacter turicensis]